MTKSTGYTTRKGEFQLRGAAREASLAAAKAWHVRNKPIFDEMDARGMFADSPARFAG